MGTGPLIMYKILHFRRRASFLPKHALSRQHYSMIMTVAI